MTDDLVKRLRHYSYEPEFAEAADRIEALEHSYASLQQAFDEMKTLAAQRLEALKEAERQRDELLAVLEDVRKCKSLYSMWRGRNKSRTYGAIIDAAIAAVRKEQK